MSGVFLAQQQGVAGLGLRASAGTGQALGFQALGLLAANGLAAGHHAGGVRERDDLHEDGQDQGNDHERDQVPEHGRQGIGVGVDDAVLDGLRQLVQGLRIQR